MMGFQLMQNKSPKLVPPLGTKRCSHHSSGAAPPTHRGQVLANSHPVAHPASVTFGWSQAVSGLLNLCRICTHVCLPRSIYNRNLNKSRQIKSNKIISTHIVQTLSNTIQSIDPLSVSVFGVCVSALSHYVVHHAWAYSFGWMRIKVALVVVSTCRLVNS